MKKIKLKSGKEVKLKEMSIDDIDFCSDLMTFSMKDNDVSTIHGLSKARTAWLRNGLVGDTTDKFLKMLSEEEKNELSQAIQEYQRLGEEKASD
ncbi:MAG: hypothetical protein H8D23_41255 [Candidatus Brocadiales bacterium]|nr:hypothetical protein [Candidatus Brocadiales bacterium]